MSSASRGNVSQNSTSEDCLSHIDKLYTDLLQLITSVEKGSGSELTARLRSVESEIASFKEKIRQIPNIQVNENRERDQISSLYRQLKLKDELIKSLSTYDITKGLQGRWLDDEKELPLARQQKGVETQKESVTGFWEVRDMFSFENVGFTHSVDGVKYLTCADCDYGPIGYVDSDTKMNYVTPSRLSEKP
ncbi:unnamed protein product [Caenorhabditis bovis]|uniref:Mediator complex subunit 9 n=1 Tax=Caenorhabditis bovis TaxID=2654633 RepID=A0A8S1F2Q4_9PELO|nr:unnamed protein product [Caenorhabditis bovis]